MNTIHGLLCSSKVWSRIVERDYLPWALDGVTLGEDVLEIGPGYGATTRVLVDQAKHLSALELDPKLARNLERDLGAKCSITNGDGTRMPYDVQAFDAVTCFTMLHHVPSAHLQDKLFAEAFRVLRPGGTFAGADSMTSMAFRLLHLNDTMVMVDPDTLAARLEVAGFQEIRIAKQPKRAFRFSAKKR